MTERNPRKKIALLRANPKDAGFGKISLHLADEYEVDCYIWDRAGDFTPIAESRSIAYERCRIPAGFHSASTLLRLMGFEAWLFFKLLFTSYDCIHAIDLDTGLTGYLAARIRAKPFVYHCLDPYATSLPQGWPKFLGKFAGVLENVLISRADMFIITDMLRMHQHEGACPAHVVEIANVPYQEMPRRKRTDDSRFLVGYIGSLIHGRNLLTLIDAVGDLAGSGVSLILGGFGPLSRYVGEYAKKHANISFMGWIPSYTTVLELESTFDVIYHVTDEQDKGQKWVSPNKLFDSMALCKPIIVGEKTLAAMRVEAVGNGIVIPYGDREELKKAILELKNYPAKSRAMGLKGLKEYESNWSPSIMKKRLLDVYDRFFKEMSASQ